MKTRLEQKLAQTSHLSPQQIKAIKLLSFSEIELLDQIDKEIEENPLLEKESDENDQSESYDDFLRKDSNKISSNHADQDSLRSLYENSGIEKNLYDHLVSQIQLVNLQEEEMAIAKYIIASINHEGFLSINKSIIISDLKTDFNIDCSLEKLEFIFQIIKTLDPLGCGSSDLQEYLFCQLDNLNIKEETRLTAKKILLSTINHKNTKENIKINIRNQLKSISKDLIDKSYKVISSLKTRPFDQKKENDYKNSKYFADFIVQNENGSLVASLHNIKQPNLIINKNYKKIIENNRKVGNDQSIEFIQSNIDRANFFIEAIKKRRETLLKIIRALAEIQSAFFLSHGDPSKLRPMVINDISEKISMHLSTVSRAITNKYIRTDFGIIPVKSLFSNEIKGKDGNNTSNKNILEKIKTFISSENIAKPFTDSQITYFLNQNGYNVARRTVSKYREQLGIATSNLRKR